MAALRQLIENGTLPLMILGIMALEAVLVSAVFLRRGKTRAIPQLLAGLAAGAALVLALRAALLDQGWDIIARFLLVSLLAHAAELGLKFRS